MGTQGKDHMSIYIEILIMQKSTEVCFQTFGESNSAKKITLTFQLASSDFIKYFQHIICSLLRVVMSSNHKTNGKKTIVCILNK